jgi:uncharacterized protein with von Willebrand factor type A (vWA) domain
MYPFGALPENLAAFCAYLRRDHGFAVGHGELHDAARALELVDISDECAVRDALRVVLSRTPADVSAFDDAFRAFFFPGPPGIAQPALPPVSREGGRQQAEEKLAARRPRATATDIEFASGDPAVRAFTLPADDDDEGAAPLSLARARYSPLEAQSAPFPTTLQPAQPAWRAAARALVRRLQLGLARRWRPAPAGPRFDLRRTLRASLQTGGETLSVRWLRRPRRAPRLVVLVDGSRSMADAALTALQVAVALATATLRVEVFTFSTGLERITDPVRRAGAGETTRLEHVQSAWGGGTAIGLCLRAFLRRFGDRLLGPHTVVIIASDGLDVGHPQALREAMREIRRRSAAVVWLNPLLETAGYEPTASGMSAARPFVTSFAAVTDAAALARLARTLRVSA